MIRLQTRQRDERIHLTADARGIVEACGVRQGLVTLYIQGLTAAMIIQLPTLPRDVVTLL